MKSSISRRGEVAKRGSLLAVVTADMSRAELIRVFSKDLPDPRGDKVLHLRVAPQGVTRTGPDRVDSGGKIPIPGTYCILLSA